MVVTVAVAKVLGILEVIVASFEGIVEYHDGLAVSDYVNMLPNGDGCLDRVGDDLVFDEMESDGVPVRGTFIDSTGTVYIAKGKALYMAKYDSLTDSVSKPVAMEWFVRGEKQIFQFWSNSGRVTFCESSIKPSVVFCCDGRYIYMWNTTTNQTHLESRDPHMVNMMYLPNMTSDTIGNGAETTQPELQDYLSRADHTIFAGWEESDDLRTYISSIAWFDNKLVGCNVQKNTVWLTRTDPMSYFRLDPEQNTNQDAYPLSPIDGIDLWYNWYSSTSNSDNLIDIASYSGQLYFFNDHSIEVWGRTGNEDSPIQSNTTQVIHYGGRSPSIFEGVLYFIAIDAMNTEFIAAFSPQFSKLSNREVERRLGEPRDLQIITQRKTNYLFVRYEDCSGFLFKENRWSRWENPTGAKYGIRNSIVKNYAITDDGRFVKFDDNIRTTGGVRYNRYIRDGFKQFDGRVLFRRFHVTMDTGKTDRDIKLTDDGKPDPVMNNIEIYMAMSTNRGLSFSQRRYRKLGSSGHNDKVIEWRGLGSGNSILIEFGTSSLHKLQLYDMGVDID